MPLLFMSRCPAGFSIGKLKPCHSELVGSSSHPSLWVQQCSELVSSSSQPSLWIQQRIENLHSVAIYSDECPTQPVSWTLAYPTRELGNAFTMDGYRRKGFISLVTAALCKLHLEDCPHIPQIASVDVKNKSGFLALKHQGFVPIGYTSWLY